MKGKPDELDLRTAWNGDNRMAFWTAILIFATIGVFYLV